MVFIIYQIFVQYLTHNIMKVLPQIYNLNLSTILFERIIINIPQE